MGYYYNYAQPAPPPVYPPPPPPIYAPPPPTRYTVWLMPLVFLVDVGLFIYTMYENNCPEKGKHRSECVFKDTLGRFAFAPPSENRMFGPSPETLIRMGALKADIVYHGEYWRLFACMWLHGGVIHLLVNMIGILLFGNRFEADFGFWRVGPLYIMSGIGGSLLSVLHIIRTNNPETISVGASGALFGLLGASLSELMTNWCNYGDKCLQLVSILLVLGLNVAVGFYNPWIDHAAHLGGFITGYLLGFILFMKPQPGYVSRKYLPPGYHQVSRHKCHQYVFFVLALVAFVALLAFFFSELKAKQHNWI